MNVVLYYLSFGTGLAINMVYMVFWQAHTGDLTCVHVYILTQQRLEHWHSLKLPLES
jgi:hypothetical protein